jgi:2-polyprenyl-3-methyl-5-hydroxy-6-metoxy-1,4-benzoquinol methylase
MESKEKIILQQTLYNSRNPTRRWLHTARRDWISETIKSCSEHAGKALEVGPGSGLYLPLLADCFSEVAAIDRDPEYLRDLEPLAHSRGVVIIAQDICDNTLPAGSFDLILCSEVIEHIPDSARAISAMHRLLKPGGRLVLSTPQKFSTLELAAKIAFLPGIISLVRMIYGETILETGHINLQTQKQITSLFSDAGFRIRERHLLGFYLPVIAEFFGQAGLRIEQRMEKLIRGGPLEGLLWTQCYLAEA